MAPFMDCPNDLWSSGAITAHEILIIIKGNHNWHEKMNTLALKLSSELLQNLPSTSSLYPTAAAQRLIVLPLP